MEHNTIVVQTQDIDSFFKTIKGKKLKLDVPVGRTSNGYITVTKEALIELLNDSKVIEFTADIWSNSVYVEGFKQ